MPTLKQIAREHARAFIGRLWGRRVTFDLHEDVLVRTLLEAERDIASEKAQRARGKVVKDTEADGAFEVFWDLYAKKTGREKCLLKWRRLNAKTRSLIMEHLPHYVEATPDATYRKNPLTYLNGAYWLDETLPANGAAAALLTHAEAVKELDQYGSATRLEDLFLIVREPEGGRVMFQRKT